MGLFNVPQFIDIEDKIAGPFTAKQLGWIGAGALILIILWFILDFAAFILVAVIIGVIFGGLAFYKPNGQPLAVYILAGVAFVVKPKVYVWKRVPETKRMVKPKPAKNATMKIAPKELTKDKLEEISKLLDHK